MAATFRNRSLAALATAALAVGAAGGLISPPVGAAEGFTLERVAGNDRYQTAAAIAADAFPGGSDEVVLATGLDAADALAGGYLAGVLRAPILLTERDSLPASTASSLEGLDAETVHILGGTGAVSQAVQAQLESDGYTVRRIAGQNRYETAQRVATVQTQAGPGEVDGDITALLVNGHAFADALAAGPLAYAERLPIVLTTGDRLSPEARAALESLSIEHVVVVGGTGVISRATVDQVEDLGIDTTRIAGQNRYETAADFADYASAAAGWDGTGVDLALGERFADALAGGPAAGEAGRPIILTASTSLSRAAADWLEDNADTLTEGRVFGGSGAVANSVVSQAQAIGRGEQTAGTQSGQLTSFDRNGDAYTFVPTGASAAVTVRYASGDTFQVDGQPASIGGFESALSAGDQISHTEASGSTPARHVLTNVAAASFTSGMIGNVDLADDQFDFINAVTGDALNPNVSYASTDTRPAQWTVDGQGRSKDQFEANLNEGDTLAITAGSGTTPTVFALTNRTVSGPANAIEKLNDAQDVLTPVVRLKIGGLGDDPATSSDSSTDPAGPGNDDKFKANGGQQSNDVFVVDGNASSYSAFRTQLSEGDLVTYSRVGTGTEGTTGQETFSLVNRAPSTQQGQAVDDLNTDGSISPADTNGGSFTIATATGTYSVTYDSSGTFIVNGRISNETEFEEAYSAGDEISFRPADQPSGTSQRLELTDKPLAGSVSPSSIRTEDSSSGPPSNTPGNSYAVLAENGTTELERVTYGTENDQHFVNGAAVTPEQFEAELNAIKAGQKSGTVIVQRSGTGDNVVEQHRLTTRTIAS